MKNTIRTILIALLILFVLIQFIRPTQNVSDIIPASDLILVTKPPQEIILITQNIRGIAILLQYHFGLQMT